MSVNKDVVVLQFNLLKFNLSELAGTEAFCIQNQIYLLFSLSISICMGPFKHIKRF